MIHTLNMVWNPSEGIDLGFFLLRFYSLSWVLAFGLGWYVMKPIFMRENESVDSLFYYQLAQNQLYILQDLQDWRVMERQLVS